MLVGRAGAEKLDQGMPEFYSVIFYPSHCGDGIPRTWECVSDRGEA